MLDFNSNLSLSSEEAPTNRLELLKKELFGQLLEAHEVQPPPGLSTGVQALDRFLLWQGLPLGELTLFHGPLGTGATSLWAETCRLNQQQGGWSAWINSNYKLHPQFLRKKQVQLQQLLIVEEPQEASQFYWILQELISSQLFKLIGCHWPKDPLKIHQLQKLKKLARQYQVALVWISEKNLKPLQEQFSLVLRCERDFLTLERAQHRTTPFVIPTPTHLFKGGPHANTLSELTSNSRTFRR